MADDNDKVLFAAGSCIGRYRIKKRIGTGAMGVVYQASAADEKDDVAIKVLNPSLLTEENAVPRFNAEIEILRKLNSNHVARILDSGVADTDPRVPYYVMELLSGYTLRNIIGYYRKKNRSIQPILVYGFGRDLFKGLAYCHANGVVHRDIKPDNIFVRLLGPFWSFKIGDFGVSKVLQGGAIITGLGGYVGTPRYSPKEQFLGIPASAKLDMYAAGVVMFRVATLLTPFYHIKNDNDLIATLVFGDPPPEAPGVESFRSDLDPRVTKFIARCLLHKFDERPDAAEGAALFGKLYEAEEARLGVDANKTYEDFSTSLRAEDTASEDGPVDEGDAEFLEQVEMQVEMEATTAKAGPRDTVTMRSLFTSRGTLRLLLENSVIKSLLKLTFADLPTLPSQPAGTDDTTKTKVPRRRGETLRLAQATFPAADTRKPDGASLTPDVFSRRQHPTAEGGQRERTLILLGPSSIGLLALLAVVIGIFVVRGIASGAGAPSSVNVAASLPAVPSMNSAAPLPSPAKAAAAPPVPTAVSLVSPASASVTLAAPSKERMPRGPQAARAGELDATPLKPTSAPSRPAKKAAPARAPGKVGDELETEID